MHLSCKLTHSVIRFLEAQDQELSPLFAAVPVPGEFMRDPSYWLRADEFENFLNEVVQKWSNDGLRKMAASCVEFRSWGVLDSVLRMMSSPAEVFQHPEQLLSYFISPAPPVDNVSRTENAMAFDVPMSHEQYPLSCEFIAYSLEVIPVFMGLPAAEVTWEGIRVSINWQTQQDSIFEGVDLGRQLSPDLMRDVLKNLGHNEQVKSSSQVLAKIKEVKPPRAPAVSQEVLEIKNHVARLSDYMIRAQQLITLLVGSKRMTPEVKQAMKRVNWEHVQAQFPQTVEDCYQIFRNNTAEPLKASPWHGKEKPQNVEH